MSSLVPCQVDAIIAGVQPGLSMIVGPPGTGKTDTAVQILEVSEGGGRREEEWGKSSLTQDSDLQVRAVGLWRLKTCAVF